MNDSMLHQITMPYPISTNRYYRTYRNITTISAEGRLFKDDMKLAYSNLKPVSDYVLLDITIHPKQKKDGLANKKIIDADNGLKCIFDSLIGIVYHDDSQIKDFHVDYGVPKANGGVTVVVCKYDREIGQMYQIIRKLLISNQYKECSNATINQ